MSHAGSAVAGSGAAGFGQFFSLVRLIDRHFPQL
jgi:hypothetical protein